MHKWLGITHSDSESESSSDEEDLFDDTFNEEKRTRANEYAQIIASRSWGLSHRDKAGLAHGQLQLTDNVSVMYQEELGQQRRVWDCALVLSKFLTNERYFNQDYFHGKKVIELGCGIGVPGLSAALLGAKQVVLTDMEIAVPWINVNIAKNNLTDNVTAMSLMWGSDIDVNRIGGLFDVILCSDLIYGDEELANLLISTISRISHSSTSIIFAHEARYAGNQGRFFFEKTQDTHNIVEINSTSLDPIYQSPNIHVHMLQPKKY